VVPELAFGIRLAALRTLGRELFLQAVAVYRWIGPALIGQDALSTTGIIRYVRAILTHEITTRRLLAVPLTDCRVVTFRRDLEIGWAERCIEAAVSELAADTMSAVVGRALEVVVAQHSVRLSVQADAFRRAVRQNHTVAVLPTRGQADTERSNLVARVETAPYRGLQFNALALNALLRALHVEGQLLLQAESRRAVRRGFIEHSVAIVVIAVTDLGFGYFADALAQPRYSHARHGSLARSMFVGNRTWEDLALVQRKAVAGSRRRFTEVRSLAKTGTDQVPLALVLLATLQQVSECALQFNAVEDGKRWRDGGVTAVTVEDERRHAETVFADGPALPVLRALFVAGRRTDRVQGRLQAYAVAAVLVCLARFPVRKGRSHFVGLAVKFRKL